MGNGKRPLTFYILSAFFGLFVLFLYGPIATILLLSFQGPNGGLTFPMNGVSLHWFQALFEQQRVGDFGGSFQRSFILALIVAALTLAISVLAGLAFRKRFFGSTMLFYIVISSLIIPSILISIGVALMFRLADLPMDWLTSGVMTHLTWTVPFGLLVMFAVFNRFDRSLEEAARDLGANGTRTFFNVILPIILPSQIGIGLISFTLSYDEFARSLLTVGTRNTLPLEIYGMTTNITSPALYALGTLTTLFSLVLIVGGLVVARVLQLRRQRRSA